MPRRMSNSERIARARAEATATENEKAAKKAAKKATKKTARKTTSRTRKAAEPERRKLVWAVGKHGAAPVATYPYPQRAKAEADAAGRGDGWTVKGIKVPMDDATA